MVNACVTRAGSLAPGPSACEVGIGDALPRPPSALLPTDATLGLAGADSESRATRSVPRSARHPSSFGHGGLALERGGHAEYMDIGPARSSRGSGAHHQPFTSPVAAHVAELSCRQVAVPEVPPPTQCVPYQLLPSARAVPSDQLPAECQTGSPGAAQPLLAPGCQMRWLLDAAPQSAASLLLAMARNLH